MAKAAKKPKQVILAIADISGYTKFMMDNSRTIEHAQAIITDLMKTVIRQVQIPLKVSKLEGDAVFLYSLRKGGKINWEERKKRIKSKLPLFIKNFRQRSVELTGSSMCRCNACSMIEKLKLKIVIHSGQAIFYRVGKFYELSGPDVIKVHRLLKNSVSEDEYFLFTSEAFSDLGFEGELIAEDGVEHYDVGHVYTKTYYPYGKKKKEFTKKELRKYSSFIYKIKNMLVKMMIMLSYKMKFKKLPAFKNLGAEEELSAAKEPAEKKGTVMIENKIHPEEEKPPVNRIPPEYLEPVIKPAGQAAQAPPFKKSVPDNQPAFEPSRDNARPEQPDDKKKGEETDEFGLPKLDI